jgi:hypothetical protein
MLNEELKLIKNNMLNEELKIIKNIIILARQ